MSMSSLTTPFVILLALAAGTSVGVASDSLLDDTCERLIRTQLSAPDTYERVQITRAVDTLSPEQWIAGRNDPTLQKIWERKTEEAQKGNRPLNEIRLVIEYQAADPAGAALNGTATCSYLTIDQDEGNLKYVIEQDEVRLNGTNARENRAHTEK